MTFSYLLAVYRNVKDTTASQQAVLAALAFCRNPHNGLCNPSVPTLSNMTHLSESTVETARDKLKEMGLLSWESGKRKGGNQSNRYTLRVPLEGCLPRNGKHEGREDEYIEDDTAMYGDAVLTGSDSPYSREGNMPRQEGNSTPTGGEPYPDSRGILPRQQGTKYKRNDKLNNNLTNNNMQEGGMDEDKFADYKCDDEIKKAFVRFWKAYPQSPHKKNKTIPDCLKQYNKQRKEVADGNEYDYKVLEALAAWKESDDWKGDPKFIHSPLNFLGKRLWAIAPEQPRSQVENSHDTSEEIRQRVIHAADMRHLDELLAQGVDVWELCEERCAKFSNGSCAENIDIPPAHHHDRQYPPQECPHFKPKAS